MKNGLFHWTKPAVLFLILSFAVSCTQSLASTDNDSKRKDFLAQTNSFTIPTTGTTEKEYQEKYFKLLKRHAADAFMKFNQTSNRKQDVYDYLIQLCYMRSQCKKVDIEELLQKGKTLIDAGENDPVFLTWYGVLSTEKLDDDRTLQVVESAYPALTKSKYPKLNHYFNCVIRANILKIKNNPQKSFWRRQAMVCLGESILNSEFTNQEMDIAFERIRYCYYDPCEKGPQWDYFNSVFEGKKVNPWISSMVKGILYINRAWERRGNGWASTVRKDGWNGFEKYLKAAEENLMKAQKLNPQFPHAGTYMITVAMGNGGDVDKWFTNAVKAQFDYRNVYYKYLWAIRPRWGGSHRQMLAFGLQCLATNRYDTKIPNFFINSLTDILSEKEMDTWSAFLSQSLVRDGIDEYYKNRLELAKNDKEKYTLFRAEQGVLKLYAGDVEVARKCLKEIPESFSFTPLFDYSKINGCALADRDNVMSYLALSEANLKKQYEHIDELINEGHQQQAIELAKKLFEKHKADPLLKNILRDKVASTILKLSSGDLGNGLTVLHLAMDKKNIGVATFLIHNGFDINKESRNKWTPLNEAAIANFKEGAELLIKHNADINKPNRMKQTPFHNAMREGSWETAELLMKHGADLNTTCTSGWGPLHELAVKGELEWTKKLVDKGVDYNVRTVEGWTPLHCACYHGKQDVVEYYLGKDIDINNVNHYGCTPLLTAIFNGHKSIAILLAEHGAEVDTIDPKGFSAIFYAIGYSQPSVVRAILKRKPLLKLPDKKKVGILANAAICYSGKDISIIEDLIKAGVNINESDSRGRTALHLACSNQLPVAEKLIELGADINIIDCYGNTALSTLVGRRSETSEQKGQQHQVIKTLLSKMKEINQKNRKGLTALDIAKKGNDPVIVKLLEEHSN